MTNLTPVSSDDPVVEHPTDQLVLGGPGGPMNQQAQQLLNKLTFFKTALADAINQANGAALLGYHGAQLSAFLDQLVPSQITTGIRLVDLQYDALLGTPFISGEVGGSVTYSLTSPATAGASSVLLASATGIVSNQLVCFISTGGRYFSSQVKSVAGLTINLMRPLSLDVASGANMFNFYNNASHPNVFGYRAITDMVLDTDHGVTGLQLVNNLSALATNTGRYSLSGGTTLSGSSVLGPDSPSDSTDLAPIFSPGASLGLTFPLGSFENGAYVVEILCRKSGVAAAINMSLSSGSPVFTDTRTAAIPQNDETLQRVKIFFSGSAEPASLVITGSDTLTIKHVRAYKIHSAYRKLPDHRKIVMLGDSWFAQTGIFERLTQNYPYLDIVNKGVGGNTAANLYSRFDTDVTPENPDAVMIICGTNDFFGSVSSRLFNWQLQRLVAKCASIGASVYLMNSSVGDDSATRLDLSRQYASLPTVGGLIAAADNTVKYTARVAIPYLNVPAGGSVTVLVGKAVTGSAPKLTFANGDFSATKTMAVGVGSNVTIGTSISGTIITNPTGVPNFSFTLPGDRWIFARLVNTGGVDAIYGGYVVIETSNFPLE